MAKGRLWVPGHTMGKSWPECRCEVCRQIEEARVERIKQETSNGQR